VPDSTASASDASASDASASDASASDAPASEPLWRRAGRWAWRYWHWPVLAGAAVFAYLQLFPTADLGEPIRPAPPLEAQTLEGEPFRLKAHRGEVVVVNVWATWCPPCRVELPQLADLSREMKGRPVQFVGLAVDRRASDVRSFLAARDVPYPTVANPRAAVRAFPGDAVPRTYLIGPKGRVRFAHEGLIMPSALRGPIEALIDEAGARE
jgi:thiol-disulfide isomerase/thioredoxin